MSQSQPMPRHKLCSMCWQDKPASEFYARKVHGVPSGWLQSYCKACHKARTTATRSHNAETKARTKLYWREWSRTRRVTAVLDLLCREYGMERSVILGESRKPEVVEPRQMACYLLRHYYKLGPTEIGRALGLHHSTVLHNAATIKDHATPEEAWMVVDLTYQLRVQNWERQGRARPVPPVNPLPAATPDQQTAGTSRRREL